MSFVFFSKALPRSEEGGTGFGYKIFWRMANETKKAFMEVFLY